MEPRTKNQILDACDREVFDIGVPEWGGRVCFKPLDGQGLDDYYTEVSKETDGVSNGRYLMSLLIVLTACDENGSLLFERGDAIKLMEKNSKVIDRVFEQIKIPVGAGSSTEPGEETDEEKNLESDRTE